VYSTENLVLIRKSLLRIVVRKKKKKRNCFEGNIFFSFYLIIQNEKNTICKRTWSVLTIFFVLFLLKIKRKELCLYKLRFIVNVFEVVCVKNRSRQCFSFLIQNKPYILSFSSFFCLLGERI